MELTETRLAASRPEVSPAIRLPPQSVEAEQALLGALLIEAQALDRLGDVLHEKDFYRREHRLIFRAILGLAEDSIPPDVVTCAEWLDRNGALDKAGGLAYLGSLANNAPGAANVTAWAEIVRERSILRQLLDASTDISGVAWSPEGRTSGEILDLAEKRIFEIRERGSRGSDYRPIRSLLGEVVDRIDELYRSESSITGVPTGFQDLDELTGGMQRSDLIVIAGRPSMGKTSLAMNIAENASIGSKVPVAIFSLEMSGPQLAARMMASLGRINFQRVRTGKLREDDWPRPTSAMGLLNEAPLFIDDTGSISPMELRARARRIKREHGLGMIVVDYLQLMGVGGETQENRATEISAITRGLKALAKELNVPVIALSQLNRGLEQRNDKRPVMSDLRESGAIEQDADVILFIYRDEVYNKESPEKGKAEIIIGKQRNGPTGTVPLTFLGEYTRFENFSSGDPRY